MLRIDSLELIGFKSFADKTIINFTDRITAVVGPNGCGKSNLSDAIGWVLGAHTARNLRGQKMEDVIFNGSEKRKQLGKAEVRLRLRRSSDQALLWQGEEILDEIVEISREYYRSGESHYFINQRRCRLMDVQKFMEVAGLGFATYALIAQGKIDSFLTAKPLDRRAIIEEAAEITGYKSKRRSAELKLEMAQQNLLRVNDIISEVERQLRSLKRQAAKARRYRKLRQDFRELQRIRFSLDFKRYSHLLEETERKLANLRASETEVAAALQAKETTYRAAVEDREKIESELERLRQEQSDIRLQLDRAENSIRYHEQQIASLSNYLENNSTEQASILKSIRDTESELKRFQEESDRLKVENAETRKELEEKRAKLTELATYTGQAEQDLENLRERLLKLSAETAALKNQQEQAAQRLEGLYSRRQRLQTEKTDYQVRLDEARQVLQEKEKRIAQRKAEEDRLKSLVDSLAKERASLETQLENLQSENGEFQEQLIALRERLQSLREIELNRSQYSEGVQKLLNHLTNSEVVRTSGTLADFIETSPQFERLVEEFLDEELEYILVDTLDEAMQGLSELRNLKSGKCTFLSVRSSNGFGKLNGVEKGDLLGEKEAGLFGRLVELLEMDEAVSEAFCRVLPSHANALVVSDMDRALQLAHSYPDSTFITLEGETLTPRGLVSGAAAGSAALGLLGLKRQKRELEQKIKAIQKKQTHLKTRLDEKRQELEEVQEKFQDNQSALYRVEKELISYQHQLEQQQHEIHRQDRAIEVVDDEMHSLQKEEEQYKEKIRFLRGRHQELEGERCEVEGCLTASQESLQQLRVEYNRFQEEVNAAASHRRVIEERKSSLEKTLQRVADQRRQLEERLETARRRKQESETQLRQLSQEVTRLKEDRIRLTSESHTVDSTLSERNEAFIQIRKLCQEMESQIRELREKISSFLKQRSSVEVEKARHETQLQNVEAQCQEQLRIRLSEAIEAVELTDVEQQEILRRHDQLKEQLDRFGPINMTALQEYQENEERHEFLLKQRRDIEQSIADTSKAIQEINRRSRERFRTAFDAINQNFKEIFQKLFGGGECGMELLDEEDVLECGIDVYAQPPGKKLQNIMLLSGGEKAMTVFALLVALFQYRPSKFCVLDEVDAPLDDANVRRFASLIQEMSALTQFIIITHNKRTMEAADALYGITMEEAGISKVLSVQF